MPQDVTPSLQFDRADYGVPAPSRIVCSSCSRDVVQSYYTVGDRILCSSCREQFTGVTGSALGRFFRATGAALGVALAGSVVWWGVRAMTGYEIGLIAIAIGYGVARAIVWGTHGQTNVMYRVLAMLITYTGIALNYVPDLATGMAQGHAVGPIQVIVSIVLSFAAPFMMGAENILGLLIIAFGLWEAWKLTRPRAAAAVEGPFSVSPAANV
jgi:hypothetical protein